MFSRRDGVLLGGTHEEGNWSLTVDEATVTAKLAKQAELFGGMRGQVADPSVKRLSGIRSPGRMPTHAKTLYEWAPGMVLCGLCINQKVSRRSKNER
jgi:hypothetical protein